MVKHGSASESVDFLDFAGTSLVHFLLSTCNPLSDYGMSPIVPESVEMS
jgi:hypothetical protein